MNINEASDIKLYATIGFKRPEGPPLQKGVVNRIQELVSAVMAHTLILIQKYLSCLTSNPNLHEVLGRVYAAERTMSAIEVSSSHNFEDKIFVPAREAFLELAWYLSKTTHPGVISAFGKGFDQAHAVLQGMEWKEIDTKNASSFTNIKRLTSSDEEESKVMEQDLAKFYSRMHEAFSEFRQAVAQHQKSVSRVIVGVHKDTQVQDKHEKFMNVWRDFVVEHSAMISKFKGARESVPALSLGYRKKCGCC